MNQFLSILTDAYRVLFYDLPKIYREGFDAATKAYDEGYRDGYRAGYETGQLKH